MEYNREEAVRAKELAIQKLSEQEYSAAKNLALRAQAMYPELDGIAQLLVVLDVFVSSEAKIGDETDWYNVLGVSSSSDEATIKKQYRAKALALHPDKNQSVGSEDAFKLMASAFRILSDPKSRAEHDAKRLRGGVVEATNSNQPNPHSNPNDAGNQGAGVFWTFCLSCGRYLRYREIFRGHVLFCRCCMNLFVANEVASPPGEAASEPNTSRRAPRNQRTAAPEQPRDGPSRPSSNPDPNRQALVIRDFRSSSIPGETPIRVYVRRRKRGRVSDEQ